MKKETLLTNINQVLFEAIKSILNNSRMRVYRNINCELIATYWTIGEEIINSEHKNKIDSQTSRQIILNLSKILTQEIGRGFSRSNLFNMRKFYLEYPNVQTLSGQLSWSHICELLIIENKEKRSFYEKEIVNCGWSIREMKRQIDSSLFERLLLSSGKVNKNKILELAQKGQEISKAEDLLKNPYVFEFLGIPENKPLYEKDLELKLIRHVEEFLLELGKGFMFVGSQQRITINNTHYYVDIVFYNKILKCYILS
jgi:predicted nuclease of restriction endonuclease-like (RecB) superfamily